MSRDSSAAASTCCRCVVTTASCPDLEAIPESVARKARLLIVNYPHNPTGAVASLGFYEEAVAFCARYGIVLVSDLAYSEITFDGFVAPSVLEVPGAMNVAVEFHSLSKTFNMAGSRIGFAVGNSDRDRSALRGPDEHGLRHAGGDSGRCGVRTRPCGGASRTGRASLSRAARLVIDGFRSLGWDIDAVARDDVRLAASPGGLRLAGMVGAPDRRERASSSRRATRSALAAKGISASLSWRRLT